jgi:bacillithiol biosynthesis cysteine-adding enzyme BshC
LEEESGIPCVPLFWLQTDDHDFDEIRTATVADPEGNPTRLSLPDPDERLRRVSVAHRTLPTQTTDLLEALAQALGDAPAASEVLALLRAAYCPGTSVADAFAKAMAAVFADEGLLVLDARVAGVAKLAAPVYRECLDNAHAIEAKLRDGERALAASGFDVQVPIRDRGALAFFHPDGPTGPRFRIQWQATPGANDLSAAGSPIWALAGTSTRISHEVLRAQLDHDPLCFSTSALLRPIVQDTLFPVAAYVAGPGEINYFGQLGPLYDHFRLPPPLLVPRGRFRCVDARARRRLGQLGLAAADLDLPATALHARVHGDTPADVADPQQLRQVVRDRITPALEEIVAALTPLGPGLQRAGQRTRMSVARAFDRLLARYTHERLARDQTALRRLRALELALRPEGIPQERFYSWPSLAGRIGVAAFKQLVFDRLHAATPFATDVHELHP